MIKPFYNLLQQQHIITYMYFQPVSDPETFYMRAMDWLYVVGGKCKLIFIQMFVN